MPDYIDTYYRRTLAYVSQRMPLRDRLTADAAIVGGGLAGLTCALDLARRRRRVAVLEAERIAWGASGRNGGFVSPGYSAGLDSIERMVGASDAAALYRLSQEGVAIVSATIAALGVADSVRPVPGILRALRYEGEAQLRRLAERMGREFGRRLDFKTREEVREILRSPIYHQGLLDPESFHFHPLNYAQALAAEIERLGGRIFEGSPVVAIEEGKAATTLRTDAGSLAAENVVIAGGGYLGRLVPALARAHLPIATYVVMSEAAPAALGSAIRTAAAVADDRRANDYYRLVEGGARLLWGGKITTRRSEPRRLGEMLRRNIVETYPQLAGLEIEAAWAGLMSYARHMMPLIGRLRPGLWYAIGFGGHGMNTTAIGGRVIAEAILGESDRWRRFAPFGLAWAGGTIGVAAAQLTYWQYRLMDRWRERAR